MSTSFTDILSRLKTLLKTDAGLTAFVAAQGWTPITVDLIFRHRKEIPFSGLPIILITRPGVRDRKNARINEEAVHTVRLYAGFLQQDAALALSQQVVFEEKICDVIEKNNPFKSLALNASVAGSANDEGSNHPSYFTVMDVEFLFQRVR